MPKLGGSRIWVGVLDRLDELDGLLELLEKEAGDFDNRAVIVGPELSYAECARLEETFDFVVKLGHEAPGQFNLILWDNVTLRLSAKNTVSQDQMNSNVIRYQGMPMSSRSEAIAIVGFSCRLPGANDAATFWSNLIEGKDSVGPPLKGRWRVDQGCKNLTPEHAKTRAGFLSCPVDTFDAAFWGLSPLELQYTDPQARMLLQLGWEAFEHAGVPPKSLRGSNASIFLGLWRDEYRDLLPQSGSCAGGEELRRYLGCSMGNAAARISHALGITGPALATETGCSSSMISIGLAMSALREGKTKLALAGGANLILKPFVYTDFQGILSPVGKSKVFQEDADGFARAEGAVFFVLKKASDAILNGDKIYALIRGFGSSQEGLSRSVGTPTVEGEARAISAALEDAAVLPSDVDWVEMHGTGTKVGDPIEVAATRKAYAVQDKNRPLVLTSVKANIGHTESVSGATGLLKVVLAMEHGAIPPQPFKGPFNPKLNLDGIHVPNEDFPWKGSMAGVSSFGITGTNSHLIVERASKNDQIDRATNLSAYILPLSAKCPSAMKELKNRHVVALKNLDDMALGNYCYTAATRRNHFQSFRSAFVASSREEMIESLLDGDRIETTLSYTDSNPPILCFLFPGQGSQYMGMGKELYQTCAIFRRHFNIVDSLLTTKYGISLNKLLLEGTTISQYSQLCIFGVEYSLLKVWGAWGLVPSLVLGHSFGEFAASVAGGALSLPTALELLVAMRTKLFDTVKPGGMLVLKSDEITTNELIASFLQLKGSENDLWIDIAALNSSEQTVVSAPPDTINSFSMFCEGVGVKVTRVGVTHAFHSRALEPIAAQFEKEAGTLSYSKRFPDVGYISSVDGKMLAESDVQDASYWRRHMRQRVEFMEAAKAASGVGKGRIFLEVGPNPILSPLVSNMASPGVELLCVSSMRKGTSELSTILEAVATLYVNGLELDWARVWNSFGSFHRIANILPLYPFQSNEVFWFTPEDNCMMQGPVQRQEGVGKLMHPLLGRKIASPLKSTHIFSTSTGALLQRAGGYLRDHKLGPHSIFPGAAYAEMALAAVKVVAKIKFGVKLEGFEIKIALPLEIEADLQTLVVEKDQVFKVAFYSQKGELSKWKLLATAKVTPLGLDDEKNRVEESMEEYGNVIQENNKDCIYDKMRDNGYNFGSAFKTLKSLREIDNGRFCYDISHPDNSSGYWFHPTVIDAMVQATLLVEPLNGLRLPTSIVSLKLHPLGDDARLRIIATNTCTRLMSLEENGHWMEIASLTGLTTVLTTFEIFQRVAGLIAEVKLLPHFTEKWIEAESLATKEMDDPIEVLKSAVCSNVPPFVLNLDVVAGLRRMEAFVCNGIVSTLQSLGWEWRQGCVVNENDIVSKLGIEPVRPQFLKRLLHYTEEAGFVTRLNGGDYKILRDFGKVDKFGKQYRENKNGHCSILDAEWKFAKFYVEKLGVILRGSESVLPNLFPPEGGDMTFSADSIYSSFTQSKQLLEDLSTVFSVLVQTYKSHRRNVRILEVGGGTGSATRNLVHLLKGSNSTYTFTDISHSFLTKAEANLPKHDGVQLKFSVLDLEKNFLSQNFKAGSYDAIVALNVLHATVDVQLVCSNLRKLLRPHGHLIVAEQLRPSPLVDIIFGHCEGYWRFQDVHRRDHCLLDKTGWQNVLNCAGYKSTICVDSGGIGTGIMVATNTAMSVSNWIIVADTSSSFSVKLEQVLGPDRGTRFGLNAKIDKQAFDGAEQFVFLVPDSDDENYKREKLWPILASFLQIAQSFKKATKLHLVSHGVAEIKDEQAGFPLAAPLIGVLRTVANEIPSVEVYWVDLDATEDEDARVAELAAELNGAGKADRFVSYRGGQRHIAKLVPLEIANPLLVPEGKVQLRLPLSRSIADVEWESTSEEMKSLKSNQIEIRILASGLNFRDLLNIMKPTSAFINAVGVGADFAGEVVGRGSSVTRWELGDSIIGMNMLPSPLPNYTVIDAELATRLPPTLTYTEGACFPTPFITAYHCLVDVGRLTVGQTVLIHTASGGVGLAAIQIARGVGATVICTAGSKRKRAYLRSLGLLHVYNSRDLSFAHGVMASTDGFGVDLVLNSLTSKGFKEASISVTRPAGRFIEMSKLNIWTPTEVSMIRPDVLYSVEDLGIPDKARLRHLMDQLGLWLADGRLRPLRHSVFEPEHVTEALGQLERALHIGKVVIRWSPNLFNDRSTYLISGGTGALGLEVMRWMLTSGAKHIILVSRHNGRADAALIKLKDEQMDISGVVVMRADVGDQAQVARLIADIEKGLHPLRGIIHAAGVLSDGTLANQNMTKMEEVFEGKVDGGWFLHSATQHLNLEHFVLFGSAVCLLGSPGQANYAAANASLIALAEHRHRLGLPAKCISWGHWGETGMAAGTNRRVFGVEPFTAERGLHSLNYLLRRDYTCHVVAAELSDDVTRGWIRDFVSQDEVIRSNKETTLPQDGATVEDKVRNIISKILRARAALEGRQELRKIGMDSLMFIELKNKLLTMTGLSFEIQDSATVDDVILMVANATDSSA